MQVSEQLSASGVGAVKAECLEFAITQGERFGIWGGLSERERRKIRRQRALTAKAREVG